MASNCAGRFFDTKHVWTFHNWANHVNFARCATQHPCGVHAAASKWQLSCLIVADTVCMPYGTMIAMVYRLPLVSLHFLSSPCRSFGAHLTRSTDYVYINLPPVALTPQVPAQLLAAPRPSPHLQRHAHAASAEGRRRPPRSVLRSLAPPAANSGSWRCSKRTGRQRRRRDG